MNLKSIATVRNMQKKWLGVANEKKPENKKVSTFALESDWFHKGDHKQVFAYDAQVTCDKHG